MITTFENDIGERHREWVEFQTYAVPGQMTLGEGIEKIPVVGGRFSVSCQTVISGPVVLLPDPENPVDAKAIKVIYHGSQIGWVPRDRTHLFRRLLKTDRLVNGPTPHIYIVHNGNRPSPVS